MHKSFSAGLLPALLTIIISQPAYSQVGGIIIDAEGVVKTTPAKQLSSNELKKLKSAFDAANLDDQLTTQSKSRVLSLKQLNEKVEDALQDGQLPVTLKYLAGLQRIEYFIVDKENQDILIVGPAEGFGPNPQGQIVGATTGRPPIQLDDLVIALRSAFTGQREIGVTIDPTEENMANLQNYIRRNSNAVSTAAAQRRYRTMGKVLGNQVVSIWGVPTDSHFAVALTEADLRMKRISLGLEPSGSRKVRSQLSMLVPQGNSLQRWWFMPYYEPLGVNAEKTIFEIKGQRAQLMAQEEIAGPDGQRQDAAFTRQTTQKFAEQFTEHFEELARANPAFAELQSLYDLSLISVLARENWPFEDRATGLETLLRDDRLPLESYPVPKFVPSSATYIKSSRGLLLGLIGGVTINMNRVVSQTETKAEFSPVKFEKTTGENDLWWNVATPTESPRSQNELNSR